MALVSVQNEEFRLMTSQLRVCQGALPMEVSINQDITFLIGGCVFSIQTFSLVLVMLVHPYSQKLGCSSGAFVKNASKVVTAAGFARTALPTVSLLGQKCTIEMFKPGLVANCTLLPGNALACMRRRRSTFELTLGAQGLTVSTVTTEITVAPSPSLVRLGSNDTTPRSQHTLLWSALPLSASVQKRGDRLAFWASNWSAAGFAYVHVLGDSEESCKFVSHAGHVGCEVRYNTSFAANNPESQICVHLLYNILGLYYARAAEYSSVGFLGVNDFPNLRSGKLASPFILSLFQRLNPSDAPFALLYSRPEHCTHCPESRSELLAFAKGAHCLSSSTPGHTRVIGIPSRMHSVDLHSSTDLCTAPKVPRYCVEYVDCLVHS